MRRMLTLVGIAAISALSAMPARAFAETQFRSDELPLPAADCPTCLTSSSGSVTLNWSCSAVPLVFDGLGNVLAWGLGCQGQNVETVPSDAVVDSVYLSKLAIGGTGTSLSRLDLVHTTTMNLAGFDSNGKVFIHDSSWPIRFTSSGAPLAQGKWYLDGSGEISSVSSLDVEVTIQWVVPASPPPTCTFKTEPAVELGSGIPADERWMFDGSQAWAVVIRYRTSDNGTLTVFKGTTPSNLTVVPPGPFSVPRDTPGVYGFAVPVNTAQYFRLDYRCSNGALASRSLSITTPPDEPLALGCFVDAPTRALPVTLTGNSPWECIAAAARAGYSFAARQNGDQCFVGNALGHTRAYDADCDVRCLSDPRASCGGVWRNKVFSTGLRAPPAVPLPLPAPISLSLGCFQEGATRALPALLMGSGATLESCIDTALHHGYTYAALQNGGECYAGDILPAIPAPSSECAMPCAANIHEICGGASHSSVYATPAFSLTASPNGGDSIHLDWIDAASDQMAFIVERRTPGDVAFSQVASLNPKSAAYDDSGLSLFSTYSYRIRANSATGGVSAHSAQVQAMSGSSLGILAILVGGTL